MSYNAVKILTSFCLMLFMVMLNTACGKLAPATVPAQLANTPGPPVTITYNVYESTAFQLEYPSNWQTVVSPAFSLPWVVFSSPDGTALIVVAVDPDNTDVTPPVQSETDLRREQQIITFDDGTTVYTVVVAPEATWDEIYPRYERALATLSEP
jgi:hypothetical protein